jgi:hypothetical protein
MVSWLLLLISPVVKLYNQFQAFRTACIYRLTITPQVCFLERALNDKYDIVSRRITISDPVRRGLLFIYTRAENKPVFIYRRSENMPRYLYTKAETARAGVDFIIKVPLAVSFNAAEMVAFVNAYKMASKRFKISVI